MPWGQRTFASVAGPTAEGDKIFADFIYNDTSAALSIGVPVYVDSTDAAELNTDATTGLTTAGIKNSGGKVVLGTNANAGANLTCVGVYQPSNRNDLPALGDPIRVLVWGRGLVSVQSPAAGAAGTVGGYVIASAAVKQAVPGARAVGVTIAMLLASRAVVAVGAQLLAAASATPLLYNGFVVLE